MECLDSRNVTQHSRKSISKNAQLCNSSYHRNNVKYTRRVSRAPKSINRSLSKLRNKSKPPVICLDVTVPSDSKDDSDIQEDDRLSSVKLYNSGKMTSFLQKKSMRETSNIVESSDSSDSEVYDVSLFRNNALDKSNHDNDDEIDIEDGDDLYVTSYAADRLQALKNIEETLKSNANIKSSGINLKTNISPVHELYKEASIDNLSSTSVSESPLKDISLSLDVSSVHVKPLKKPRRTRKMKEALQSLKSFSQRFSKEEKNATEDHDKSIGDIILIDKEESPETNIKIRWGISYIKFPIQKDKKLLVLYQHLAEKYNVSVSQVVLSCNDRILSPDVCVRDSGVSVADIVEGGLVHTNYEKDSAVDGKQMISLKVQSSNKKDSSVIKLGRYDKMLILMEKYAKSKNVDLKGLKFVFDGETIDPNHLVSDLDLEGGECIDVFFI